MSRILFELYFSFQSCLECGQWWDVDDVLAARSKYTVVLWLQRPALIVFRIVRGNNESRVCVVVCRSVSVEQQSSIERGRRGRSDNPPPNKRHSDREHDTDHSSRDSDYEQLSMSDRQMVRLAMFFPWCKFNPFVCMIMLVQFLWCPEFVMEGRQSSVVTLHDDGICLVIIFLYKKYRVLKLICEDLSLIPLSLIHLQAINSVSGLHFERYVLCLLIVFFASVSHLHYTLCHNKYVWSPLFQPSIFEKLHMLKVNLLQHWTLLFCDRT